MDRTNYIAPLSAQQLFISLNERSHGSIYLNPDEIAFIGPWGDDGALVRLRGVGRPFQVDESPDLILGLIDGRTTAAAQTVDES
jgi:hypothetical protein